jgi:hypothetical protein
MEDLGFGSWQEQEIFLFCKTFVLELLNAYWTLLAGKVVVASS